MKIIQFRLSNAKKQSGHDYKNVKYSLYMKGYDVTKE